MSTPIQSSMPLENLVVFRSPDSDLNAIGVLKVVNGRLHFEGDAEKSARVFFDLLMNWYKDEFQSAVKREMQQAEVTDAK
jgi:hypothetical protein